MGRMFWDTFSVVGAVHNPTSRLYRMTFTGDDWTLHREDPDFRANPQGRSLEALGARMATRHTV